MDGGMAGSIPTEGIMGKGMTCSNATYVPHRQKGLWVEECAFYTDKELWVALHP